VCIRSIQRFEITHFYLFLLILFRLRFTSAHAHSPYFLQRTAKTIYYQPNKKQTQKTENHKTNGVSPRVYPPKTETRKNNSKQTEK